MKRREEEGDPMSVVEKSSYVGINPLYKLRNDKKMVISFLFSSLELKYHIFDPQSAIIVSLMNGKRTITDIIEILKEISPNDTEEQIKSYIDLTLSSIINSYAEKEEYPFFLISNEGPLNQCMDYDPCNFVISHNDFSPSWDRMNVPIQLLVMITGKCQTNCRYCYSDLTNLRDQNALTKDEWIRIFKQAKDDYGIEMICPTGGDPWAHPQAAEIWTAVTQMGYFFSMSTKCYVSYEEAKSLVDAGFLKKVQGVAEREFQISIDSLDDKVAEHLVGATEYPKRAIQSIKNLLKAGIIPHTKSVITPHNYKNIGRLVEVLYDLGVKRIHLAKYSRSFYRDDEQLYLSDEESKELVAILSDVKKRIPDINMTGDALSFTPRSEFEENKRAEQITYKSEMEKNKAIEKFLNRTGCSAGRSVLAIGPNGKSILCEQMEMSPRYQFGDFTKQTIQEVWDSQELKTFTFPEKSQFKGTICEECPSFDQCVRIKGQCFRDNHFFLKKFYEAMKDCPYRSKVLS